MPRQWLPTPLSSTLRLSSKSSSRPVLQQRSEHTPRGQCSTCGGSLNWACICSLLLERLGSVLFHWVPTAVLGDLIVLPRSREPRSEACWLTLKPSIFVKNIREWNQLCILGGHMPRVAGCGDRVGWAVRPSWNRFLLDSFASFCVLLSFPCPLSFPVD